MNFGRLAAMVVAFAVLAMAVVHLRTEQTRGTARMLAAEARWSRLRSELWSLQTRAARQKTPARIHDCIDQFQYTDLLPPGTEQSPSRATALTAVR